MIAEESSIDLGYYKISLELSLVTASLGEFYVVSNLIYGNGKVRRIWLDG